MTATAAGIRRRLEELQGPAHTNFYFVEADETDAHRLPGGPEVQAEVAAIRATDPDAHILHWITVDGTCTREEAAVRLAALRAARAAEERTP